jgi:type I restriction enzyme S subunit
MIVPGELAGANLTQGTARVAPAKEIDPRYLRWAMRSTVATGFWDAAVAGATFRALNLEPLAQTPIPAWTLNTQVTIADFLDGETARIDALIVAKRRMIHLQLERLEAAIDSALLRVSGEVLVPLKRAAGRIIVGIAESATQAYALDGVPLIRSTNIRPNRLDLNDLLFIDPAFADRNRSKYILYRDIVTVRTGNAGVSALVPRELTMSQCFTQLITTVTPPKIPEVVCYALNSGPTRQYFAAVGWGSAQSNISVPLLSNAPIPLPSTQEQAAVLDEITQHRIRSERILDLLNKQVALLAEHRQALITAAVTGQTDPVRALA